MALSAFTGAAASLDSVTYRALRTALGQYATGVAVVTAVAPDGRPVGMTINSFSSLSLDPPLVLWCLRLSSANFSAFTVADYFAINVLAANQVHLARRFSVPTADRFAGLHWHAGRWGLPLLHGRIGAFICRQSAQVRGGDHLIIIGHLEEHAVTIGQVPLIFYNGEYHTRLPAH